MTTPYIDPNLIFAENAPVQDKPAAFQNYDKGWDASRTNDGRPLIPQMNYLTQQADLKNLYIHENGAALPYKDGITYEENAVVVKDGVLQQWKGGVWVLVKPEHNDLSGRDVAEAHPASAILDASGKTQQDINDFGGSKWRNKAGGYALGATVKLDNGDIVKSTLNGNTNDPNVDMTGWEFNLDKPLPILYGAKGDGTTNDTEAFIKVESSNAYDIDLGGNTYVVDGRWSGSSTFVRLTKNYKNGKLIVSGRELVFDIDRNFSESAASVNSIHSVNMTDKKLSITRPNNTDFEIWRPLGGHYWHQYILRRSSLDVPLNLQEQRIKQLFGYITAEDSGLVYDGVWGVEGATTWLRSSSPTHYINGRGRQATTSGESVTITYNGAGDLFVIYVGRTSGGFVNVEINGSSELVNLPHDGNDLPYFDTYSATDLNYKQVKKIATGLEKGTYTIKLTNSNLKNPLSSGNRFVFNALAYDGSTLGPQDQAIKAKTWAPGQAVLQYQERRSFGNTYYALTSGVTGSTAPTGAGESISDGSVSWAHRSVSSYDLVDTPIQLAGSQLEYAYEMIVDGSSVKEDVGGALHGNETQQSMSVFVDNDSTSMDVGEWVVGTNILVQESIFSYSAYLSPTTQVISTRLNRNFSKDGMRISHSNEVKVGAQLGYYYPHMLPILHYAGGVNAKYVVDNIWSSGDGYRKCSDWYGVANPFVGNTKDLLLVANGQCLQPNGVSGIPTTQKAPFLFKAWLSVSPESVDSFDDASSIFASKAMNTSGVDVSSGGYSSMTSKMYFERYSALNPKYLPVGTVFNCSAFYGLTIEPN